jgi:hypothetical protein
MTMIPKIVLGAIVAAVLGVASWATYVYIVPQEEPPDLTPIQWVLAERAVEQWGAGLKLPKNVNTVTEPFLRGDKGPDLAKLLKPEMENRKLILKDANSIRSEYPEIARWFETIVGNEAGKWADQRWQKAGVQALVRGRAQFLDRDNHTICELEVVIEDSVTGKVYSTQTLTPSIERSLFNLDYYRLSVAEWGVGSRIFLWIVFLIGLPVACYPLAVRFLKKGSNGANLALLAGLTFADMFLVFALSGFYAPGLFGGAGLLIALGLSGFYNYGMLTEIDDLRR